MITSPILVKNGFDPFRKNDLDGSSEFWRRDLSSNLILDRFISTIYEKFVSCDNKDCAEIGKELVFLTDMEAKLGDVAYPVAYSVLSSLYGDENKAYAVYDLLWCIEQLLKSTGIVGDARKPTFDTRVFALYEYLAHLNCYIFQTGSDQPLAERIEHPAYLAFMGALILKSVPVNSGNRKLASLVAEIIARNLDNDSMRKEWIIKNACNNSMQRFDKILDALNNPETGPEFVINIWYITSLLHDYGFYPATIWDLFELNFLMPHSKPERTLCTFSKTGAFFGNTLGKQMLITMSSFPFINQSHFKKIKGILDNEVNRFQKSARRKFYTRISKHCHPFWSCAEIFSRMTLSDSLNCYQRSALALAAGAIYSHHFMLDRKANIYDYVAEKLYDHPSPKEQNLLDIERKNLPTFREEPLAFMLILLDNCQNFSRFKFKKKPSGSSPDQPAKTWLRLVSPAGEEKLTTRIKLQHYKPLKRKLLRITFTGRGNIPARVKPLAEMAKGQMATEVKCAKRGDDAFLLIVDPDTQTPGSLPQ
ncbi:hypothetical protein ES702_00442 [subsurface metagenome]